MCKKIFLTAISSLLLSGSLYANEAAPYVGGSLGVTTNTSANGNFRGIPFTIFAGYNAIFYDCFYIAGELFGVVGTAEFSNHGLKSSYGYGASILPGLVLIDHTVLFMRVGVIGSRFVSSDTKVGGQAGLGMQTSLTQSIDLRGEYDFSAFGSFTKNGASNNPRTDTFNVSLIYNFD